MNFTLEQYLMGRDKKYACPQFVKSNAEVLLVRVNKLCIMYNFATGRIARELTSGWRPVEVNNAVPGAAKNSKHTIGQAIDVSDDDGALDTWLLTSEGLGALDECQLWLESPGSTPRWSHLQSVSPNSGKRVFNP